MLVAFILSALDSERANAVGGTVMASPQPCASMCLKQRVIGDGQQCADQLLSFCWATGFFVASTCGITS